MLQFLSLLSNIMGGNKKEEDKKEEEQKPNFGLSLLQNEIKKSQEDEPMEDNYNKYMRLNSLNRSNYYGR